MTSQAMSWTPPTRYILFWNLDYFSSELLLDRKGRLIDGASVENSAVISSSSS